jgi:hypothetical protein
MEGLMDDERLPRWQSSIVIALLSVLSWVALIVLSELVIRVVELL